MGQQHNYERNSQITYLKKIFFQREEFQAIKSEFLPYKTDRPNFGVSTKLWQAQ